MPKIELKTFEEEVLKVIEREVGAIEKNIATEIRRVYENIAKRSPRISFYYVANHIIDVRTAGAGGMQMFKSGGGTLNPAVKPPDALPGQFASLAAARLAKELSKLNKFELGDIVIIRNDVPYADDVETRHSVYLNAAADFGLNF